MKRISLRLASILVLVASACDNTDFTETRPILTLSSLEAIDYGNNPVLQKITRTIELGNVGKAQLNVTLKIVPGTVTALDGSPSPSVDPNVFMVEVTEGALPTELASGEISNLLVSFQATQEGRYTGTFVIESNDKDTPLIEIPLTGTANTSARIDVQPADCLDFGRVGESRSLIREVTVTSLGTAPLEIGQLEIGGPAAGSFSVLGSKAGGTLPVATPPASVKIGLKYSPDPAMADANGDLIASLVLSTNDPFNRTLNVCLKGQVNRQPVADGRIIEPHPGQTLVAPGTTVGLDAKLSSDPDNDVPLTFKWTIVEKPDGSAAAPLGDDTAEQMRFTTDVPGVYQAQLVVTDAAGLASKAQRITINAAADNRVRIELIWDHPVADLDLHMRPVGKDLNSIDDCYGYNQQPTTWGSVDPPYHYGDKLSGFGPETIDYTEPADGRYQISVVYVSPKGAADTAMTATVRVYQFGVVRHELSRGLMTPGERWDVGVFSWPSGGVTPGEGSP